MLTVCTWYWVDPNCRTQFLPLHIEIWAAMVRRHLTLPHRIACITNEDIDIPGVEIIPAPRDFENVTSPTWGKARPQCYRRLAMFRQDAAQWLGERFVCMDMDCTIGASLDELFSGNEDFRILRGTTADKPYNGSLLMMNAGARPQVYTEFTPAGAEEAGRRFVGSDQAWLAHILGPNELTWDANDGLAFHNQWDAHHRRIRFHTGSLKPWNVDDPWTQAHYRGDRKGRCLLLGYGPTLWADVDAVIGEPFAAVIASPEAAEHWPGPIIKVVETNQDAARLAWLHGFDDVVWCGLEEAEAA